MYIPNQLYLFVSLQATVNSPIQFPRRVWLEIWGFGTENKILTSLFSHFQVIKEL